MTNAEYKEIYNDTVEDWEDSTIKIYRCPVCGEIIEDLEDAIIETDIWGDTIAWHSDCFDREFGDG